MSEVRIQAQPISNLWQVISPETARGAYDRTAAIRERLAARSVWNITATAVGGGAEMLRSLLPYVRGAGIDVRWVVIGGGAEFFRVATRLHRALNGFDGYNAEFGDHDRAVYEEAMRGNAAELAATLRPRDIVVLHGPHTAGLAPHLINAGALVVWRCGSLCERSNAVVENAWAFLAPYLREVTAFVFARPSYVPQPYDQEKTAIISRSIDPFSAKNQELDTATVRAILVHVGLVEGPAGDGMPTFTREDGSPGRVDRHADVFRLGRAPMWDTPLVVQISRWDRLDDPLGVLLGFADLVSEGACCGAQLVLAGPNVQAMADQAEAVEVFNELVTAWRALPHGVRSQVHMASLPMADAEENAAIVNALQRHAAVIVQKSLHEGFGLTVTEAMWKAKPVVASAIGGIQDQIVDGVHGLLVGDPNNRAAFVAALHRMLEDPAYARKLGEQARGRVREEYLGVHHLLKFAAVIERVDSEG